ncbi:MAG: hypothetical protein KGZ37_02485 [Nitrosarchaeum sp.]|nr:hypothetical protein [Nitrosarchaeum sp.]
MGQIHIIEINTISNELIAGKMESTLEFRFNPINNIKDNSCLLDIEICTYVKENEFMIRKHISKTSFKLTNMTFGKYLLENDGLDKIVDLVQMAISHSRVLYKFDNFANNDKLPLIFWTSDLKEHTRKCVNSLAN